jgi:hypothetical protein
MYKELPALGVYNQDIRYENILAAPEGPRTLPSLHSPFTGNQYQYRMIDLDRCVKLNSLAKFVEAWHRRALHKVVKMITREPPVHLPVNRVN